MGENKFLISFSLGLGFFLWWFDMFWYKDVCVHSFPTCLLDFEWRIPADRQDQDKIFLFITRKTEQLQWLQRALKHQLSGPQKPPQWTLKNKTVPVILKRYRVWIHKCRLQVHSAFLLCWPYLRYFYKICIHGFSIQMLGNIKLFLTPEFTRQNDGCESVISQGALLI